MEDSKADIGFVPTYYDACRLLIAAFALYINKMLDLCLVDEGESIHIPLKIICHIILSDT